MRLPNGIRAVVDIAKLRDYCLNTDHEDGKHKARVFAAALGLGPAGAEWLRGRLLEAAATQPAFTVSETRFGTLYVVRLFVDDCVRFSRGEERLGYSAFRGFSAVDHLLRKKERNSMKPIPLLAPVALTEDIPLHNLTRGQIGTVVEHLEREGEEALLVEFSDGQGQTYAMAEIRPDRLIVLHRKTEAA